MTERALLKAILFDIDGTLIDSNELHVSAWDEAFREAGHARVVDAIREEIGKGGDNLVPSLLPDASENEQKAIAERHGKIFKQSYLDRAKPFPGASDLLRRVHSDGLKVVLASSAKRDELNHYVALLGVKDIVAATATIDDVDRSKPDPDIFHVALEKAAVAPEAALALGDTIWDVEAAGKAGVRTVALLSGGVPLEKLESAGAIAVFNDVAAILQHYDATPLRGYT
jgi:HAD superfamily hydrolase (TIGR01509 family)